MYKPTPGPQGLSCLTCRQRRKKCDKNRPLCDRCVKGGFECLGYDNNGGGRDRGGKTLPPKPILPLPTVEPLPDIRDGMTTVEIPTKHPNKSFENLISGSSFELPSPTTNSVPLVNNLIDSHLGSHCNFGRESPNDCYNPIDHLSFSNLSSIKYFNDLWPQNQTHSLVRRRFLRGSPSTVERSPLPLRGQLDIMGHLDVVIQGFCSSIPRSVDANNSMRSSYLTFILDVYETQRARKLFGSPPEHLRSALVARMKRSGTMLWFMYLGARIFQAFSKVPENAVVTPYTHLVNKFDQQITTYSDRNPSIEDLEDRLSAMLELVFLKFVTISTGAGYSLLRRSLPTFFQVVSYDSTLWSEEQGVLVSFPRALASHRHEVRRFTFYDTMLAFILGLPPMVEYDVSEFLAAPVQAQPFEWVHGIPIELIVNIVQVNGWRAVTAGVPDGNEWVELEMRSIAWKPNVQEIIGGDSSELVVRLAVQEAWRHAVLIYIYMGMAGFLSDDIRVQRAVRQIVKLFNIDSSSPIDVHFVIPCIVSGIAARYEHQRTTIREKLLSFCNMRVWFCPGSDFVKVLDHLWHGVGRDGVAVAWEDYIYSRSDVLPV